MKKMIKKYNSSFEFKGLVDGIAFVTMIYVTAQACKYMILALA